MKLQKLNNKTSCAINKQYKTNLLIYFILYLILLPAVISNTTEANKPLLNLIGTLFFTITMVYNSKTLFKKIHINIINVIVSLSFLLLTIYLISFVSLQSNTNQNTILNQLFNSPLITITILTILGPIMEELVFHFSIFHLLSAHLPKRLGIVLTAAIFSALHCTSELITNNLSLINFFEYFIFSTTLCYLKNKKDNVYNNILVHSLYNVCALILL